MAAFMSAEQRNEQTKRMLEQFKTPQARQQFLQSWLAQEVLYRQALQEELALTAELQEQATTDVTNATEAKRKAKEKKDEMFSSRIGL